MSIVRKEISPKIVSLRKVFFCFTAILKYKTIPFINFFPLKIIKILTSKANNEDEKKNVIGAFLDIFGLHIIRQRLKHLLYTHSGRSE